MINPITIYITITISFSKLRADFQIVLRGPDTLPHTSKGRDQLVGHIY